MAPITYNDDYLALISRGVEKLSRGTSKSKQKQNQTNVADLYTIEERKQILEYQRVNKLHSPEITMIHGSVLLQNPRKIGEDCWVIYEQVCIASLHLGYVEWAAYCIDQLATQFPNSKRVKRVYALYRECVGEWSEATTIYRDILKESPENTYSRKRSIAMKRQQGLVSDSIDIALSYLQSFGTDKEVWHDLAQTYLENARLPQALFCYEDLLLQDPRNLYYVITYAELLYSLGQCTEHFELSRKYFCLALQCDDTNLRALWGLFFCSCSMFKRDQGAEKVLALQHMCVEKIKKTYKKNCTKKSGNGICMEIMLSVLDSEIGYCEESIKKKIGN